jgi:ribosomal-protein-alanine N-acetyltransferase
MPSSYSSPSGKKYRILNASWQDFSDLYRLEKICFQDDAWPFPDVLGVLTLPSIIRLKAVNDGKMVGFIAADLRRRDRTAWIATFAVLPEHRRSGLGSALLLTCEGKITLPNIKLSVRRSNSPAITLYEKFGYNQVDIWPKYYQGKEDALIFEKPTPTSEVNLD